MATEHDVILRVGLDTRDADEKAAKTARNLSGMAGGGAGGAGSFRIGAGLAAGAVDIASSALAAAGAEKAGSALRSVAGDMAKFGTMLAPLGPVAAGAGVAIGALTGGLKTFAEDARKTREELAASRRTSEASRISAIIEHRDFAASAESDPRGALAALRRSRRAVEDLGVKADVSGAHSLSQQEVEYMASWDPDQARRLLEKRLEGRRFDVRSWEQNLLDALNYGEVGAKGDAAGYAGQNNYYSNWWLRAAQARSRYSEIATGKWRGGPDEADLERRIAEEAARDAVKEAKAPARALFAPPARADAMQAAGMGVAGGAYDRQEKYLERIVALLGGVERNTGRPARPAPAVAG